MVGLLQSLTGFNRHRVCTRCPCVKCNKQGTAADGERFVQLPPLLPGYVKGMRVVVIRCIQLMERMHRCNCPERPLT